MFNIIKIQYYIIYLINIYLKFKWFFYTFKNPTPLLNLLFQNRLQNMLSMPNQL